MAATDRRPRRVPAGTSRRRRTTTQALARRGWTAPTYRVPCGPTRGPRRSHERDRRRLGGALPGADRAAERRRQVRRRWLPHMWPSHRVHHEHLSALVDEARGRKDGTEVGLPRGHPVDEQLRIEAATLPTAAGGLHDPRPDTRQRHQSHLMGPRHVLEPRRSRRGFGDEPRRHDGTQRVRGLTTWSGVGRRVARPRIENGQVRIAQKPSPYQLPYGS